MQPQVQLVRLANVTHCALIHCTFLPLGSSCDGNMDYHHFADLHGLPDVPGPPYKQEKKELQGRRCGWGKSCKWLMGYLLF